MPAGGRSKFKKTSVPLRLGKIPTFEGSVGALTSRDVGAMVAFRTLLAAVLRSPISKKTTKDLATAVACREVAKKRERTEIFFGSPEIFFLQCSLGSAPLFGSLFLLLLFFNLTQRNFY